MQTNYLSNPEFLKTWEMYTEYLQEDHAITLTKKDVEKQLSDIHHLAGDDVPFAAQIVELAIINNQISFDK